MAGGFNPLKDVYKTKVFELCQWRNKNIGVKVSKASGDKCERCWKYFESLSNDVCERCAKVI